MNADCRHMSRHMTLVEILLATFILTIGMMGIMSLVPVAMRNARSAIQKTHAASVAQNAKVALKRSRLYMADSNSEFTWDLFNIDDGVPDGIDGTEFSALLGAGFGFIEQWDDENNREYFVPAEPNTARPYAWRVDEGDIEELNGSLGVTVTVFFPTPYDTEIYRMTFKMQRPE